jgi:hypothetical protein
MKLYRLFGGIIQSYAALLLVSDGVQPMCLDSNNADQEIRREENTAVDAPYFRPVLQLRAMVGSSNEAAYDYHRAGEQEA